MKYRVRCYGTGAILRRLRHLRHWVYSVSLLAGVLLFGGCTALEEAALKREKRLLEERDATSLLLEATDATISVRPDGLFGESDHYTLTFAEDLVQQPAFDEAKEREVFAESALGYMESLYAAMNQLFGFQPKHKIHVTLYHLYQGSTLKAVTRTQYGRAAGRSTVKVVKGIHMDFPIQMYDKHGVRVHELTHAFTNIYFLPVWFSEGLAVLIQSEYAKGGSHPKFDSLEANLRVDLDGVNQLESWGSHSESGPLTEWRYRYAYTVVAELWQRYGADFYIRVFQLMEEDGLHVKLEGSMPTSFLVYYFNKAAGEDLVPLFQKLHFKVRSLTEAEILEWIEAGNKRRQRFGR